MDKHEKLELFAEELPEQQDFAQIASTAGSASSAGTLSCPVGCVSSGGCASSQG